MASSPACVRGIGTWWFLGLYQPKLFYDFTTLWNIHGKVQRSSHGGSIPQHLSVQWRFQPEVAHASLLHSYFVSAGNCVCCVCLPLLKGKYFLQCLFIELKQLNFNPLFLISSIAHVSPIDPEQPKSALCVKQTQLQAGPIPIYLLLKLWILSFTVKLTAVSKETKWQKMSSVHLYFWWMPFLEKVWELVLFLPGHLPFNFLWEQSSFDRPLKHMQR